MQFNLPLAIYVETVDYPDPTHTVGIFCIVTIFLGDYSCLKNRDPDILSQEKNVDHKSTGTVLFTLSQIQ